MQIIEKLLTVNPYSNPNKPLNKVKAIVIHWVANPLSSAEANRNYFENRKYGKTNYGSAHYIVEGTKVVQCLPLNKMAYHVGSTTYTQSALRNLSSYPNNCSVGIEMTHPDSTGKPTDSTYKTTVELTAFLCNKFGLTEKNIWTHQQVVGWKNCHKYYVDNPKEWVRFISDVAKELNGKQVTIPTPKPTNPNDLVFLDYIGHGDKGSQVKDIQEKLSKLGYSVGTIDGIFGDKTDAAVERFQRDNGLTVDGIVGKNTLAKMESLLNGKSQEPKLEEAMKMKMSEFINDHNMYQLEVVYKEAREAGLLQDDRWEKKAKDKSLTIAEATLLSTILDHRRFREFCNKK
ncbi:peptidoglycan recognition protein family protein [Bacillus infantis]|uniref:peptidoglycan recognition protein family protein n=1 Tax=Bacillus infantis TaxID=324767 RepID=UPI003CF1965D